MRCTKLFRPIFLFLLLIALNAFQINAWAADDDDYDEYDVTARVARVSYLRGDVDLRRSGNQDWERARLNFPLVEGDTLATGSDGRVEIQIDARNFVRLNEDSALRVVTLRNEGIALSLTEGTATIRIARFERDREYFEVDAPQTTMAVEKPGLYRLDVSHNGGVQIAVRDDGRARIYSSTSGFTLRDGRSASLSFDASGEGDWQLGYAPARDNWDEWVNDRERYLSARLRYDNRTRYYDADVWGAEELDAYGDWVYVNDYGWIWRPHITVINNYNNWAPYRYGHWVWCPPYGWTWVGDEPWGWAPYHYGRWVYYDNNWCWAPRGYGYHYKRAWWRPALVAFIFLPTSYGEHVAWYPLTYGQHDPHSRRYQQRAPERLTPLRSDELANLQRVNPAYLRAVTTVPARNFGSEQARLQPANTELARRAVSSEPVRGRLPIAPANADASSNAARVDRPARTIGAARPAPVVPAATLPERPTGAAERRAGVALDDELRRTRLYNGREPRDLSGAGVVGPDNRERDTGAVMRPARPGASRPIERGANTDAGGSTSPAERPARPVRTAPQVERPSDLDEDGNREMKVRRPTERRPQVPPAPQDSPSERPAQRPGRMESPAPPAPSVEERRSEPARPVRPSSPEVERPDRTERRERQERNVPPPSRSESPAPRYEPPPRSEPRQESRPEPRPEPAREQPSRAPERPSDSSRGEAPARPARPSKGRDDSPR